MRVTFGLSIIQAVRRPSLLFPTNFCQSNGERDTCGEYLLYNDLSFDVPISNWNRKNLLKV